MYYNFNLLQVDKETLKKEKDKAEKKLKVNLEQSNKEVDDLKAQNELLKKLSIYISTKAKKNS